MPAVRDLFSDLGFARNNDFMRVVLFAMVERQVSDIDLDYYQLRKVYLSDVSHDRTETMSQQIRALRIYIYRTAQPNENVLAILNCLNNTDYPVSVKECLVQVPLQSTKKLNFLEGRSSFLDYYIPNRRKRNPSQRQAYLYFALSN